MDGFISDRSLCRRAVVVRNVGDVYICADQSFVPPFQVIVQRYWIESWYQAVDLIASLDSAELGELLCVSPGQTVGSDRLQENGFFALRERVYDRLTTSQIKLYRFSPEHYSGLMFFQQPLLTDMRKLLLRDIWNSPNASLKDISDAIAYELTQSLIQRGLAKDGWDRTLREENGFWRAAALVKAAANGLADSVTGVWDTAVATVDIVGDIIELAGKGIRLHLEYSEALLTGDLAKIQKLVKELGGTLDGGIEGIKRLLEDGKRIFETLLAEPMIAVMLAQYIPAYYSATPQAERVRGTFKIGGDILIALAVTVATGGVGGVAGAANAARNFGIFSGRLIQLLAWAFRVMSKAASKATDAAEEARLLARYQPTRLQLPSEGKLKVNSPPEPEIPNKISAARARQQRLLEKNIGYNVSPTAWDSYPTIGRNGTFVSDKQGITDILGDFSGKTKAAVDKSKIIELEEAFGLERGTLQGGFKVREVDNILEKMPRSPLEGNRYFLGPGNHLPGGAPEMVIESIPTSDTAGVKTILEVISK